ncbi:hypothetical protein ENH_00054860 [Eimeria necatrix]|uniref:Uncharacterized protein n=1 Tax=Eimeria necatrix TaxID=51315 RepID=U6MZU1_9EIME|nr:hypothetical protein ENH_00054860 [Eimeria necatrix]CDJ68543.1 hypothetical protein ENH_00054860 [Eimeria necatrix]
MGAPRGPPGAPKGPLEGGICREGYRKAKALGPPGLQQQEQQQQQRQRRQQQQQQQQQFNARSLKAYKIMAGNPACCG